MKTNLIICFVAAVLGASACSSSDSGDGSPESEGGGTIALGETCVRSSECAAVQGKEVSCQCTPDSSETVCVALLEPGEPCGGGSFALGCRSDSQCVSRNGADAACEAFAKLGESCEDSYCAAGSSCESDTCVPAKSVGETCNRFEPQPCVPNAYCDFMSKTCMARVGDGDPCSSNDECAEGGACWSVNGADATCVSPKADGQPCESSFDCGEQSYCGSDGDGVERCMPQDSPTGCGSMF